MEWILVTGYTFLFLFLIGKSRFFQSGPIPFTWFQAAFLLKVLAGISLGLLYTYYYTDRTTSDTFKFFDDSGILFNTLWNHPWDFFRMFTGIGGNAPELKKYYVEMGAWLNSDVLFNDNKTIIRFNTLCRFFSLGNYYVHVVFINFISFFGMVCMYRTFCLAAAGKEKILFALVFLLPSVLFWGSGLLKDGLLLFAFGVLVYMFRRLVQGNTGRYTTGLFTLSLFLLVFIKFYVLLAVVPGLIAWYWSRGKTGMPVLLRFTFLYTVYFTAGFNLHYLFPKYELADILYWKQANFYVLATTTHASSVIDIPRIAPDPWSILVHAPCACLRALTRPFITDAGKNPLILMSSAETLAVLLLLTVALFSTRKHRLAITPFFAFSLFYFLIIFSLIGMITPILGALVRYKVPALPFLMFLIARIYVPPVRHLNT